MADNVNSALDMLKGILGDNAEEKIKSLLSPSAERENPPEEPAELESTKAIQMNNNDYSAQIQSLINGLSRPNDPRSQLLLSLKPYMSENRRRGIDNAVKLLNISKISGMFK